MVKDHSDSEREKLLLPHGLLFLISSKGSFICIIPQTGYWALAGMRNSSMGPPWRIDPTTHHTMSECSYHRATSRSEKTNKKQNTESVLRMFLVNDIQMLLEKANNIWFVNVYSLLRWNSVVQGKVQITAKFVKTPDKELVLQLAKFNYQKLREKKQNKLDWSSYRKGISVVKWEGTNAYPGEESIGHSTVPPQQQ